VALGELGARQSNKALHRTGLTGKHFAKTKSKMLTSEARGSAWRWAVQERARPLRRTVMNSGSSEAMRQRERDSGNPSSSVQFIG
jgi:hypothetical protein